MMSTDTSCNEANNILVVGDWVIDERWLVGIHRSRTSARVGRTHYHSIQPLESPVMELSAAGRTARILQRAKTDQGVLYDVKGVGLWHHDDTDCLLAMLDPAAIKRCTPHQIKLTLAPEDGSNQRKLVNLAPEARRKEGPGTTRVIRVYQQTGSVIKLLERIDWELKTLGDGWYSQKDLTSLQGIFEGSLPHIVVHDLGKGVLSPALVQRLDAQFQGAEWFIFSKLFDPEWIAGIQHGRVRLIEIPEAAAQEAIDKGKLDAWLTIQDRPTRQALELLKNLATERFKGAMVVAIPNNTTVLAHCSQDERGGLWVDKDNDTHEYEKPMSSVCFAALVSNMLQNNNKDASVKDLLQPSISFTKHWQEFNHQRLEPPLDWDPEKEPTLPLKPEEAPPISIEDLNLQKRLGRWVASSDGVGIIKEDDGMKACIELWRSMTLVKKYVCLVRSKRAALRQVLDEVGAFEQERARDGRGTARSCMIVAKAGSGKSFLAGLLAEDHNLNFLEFNITQMIAKSDILDCFDLIRSTQFQDEKRGLLVFVDEIDARLAAEPVYDAFLDPLERGVYRKAGRIFPIQPCFWLFAGTSDPEKAGVWKGKDFVSRLTLKPVSMEPTENESCRLENVYLGVALLRKKFSDVREVSNRVLDVLYGIPPNVSFRELRQFISEFVNVQWGEVRFHNIPQSWYERLGIRKDMNGKRAETMVEIRENPRSEESRTTSQSTQVTPARIARPLGAAA